MMSVKVYRFVSTVFFCIVYLVEGGKLAKVLSDSKLSVLLPNSTDDRIFLEKADLQRA